MDRPKIIHMDDHLIFTAGLFKELKPEIAETYYLQFNNEDDVLAYMINSIHADDMPTLLITDLAHPGLNGYGFAKRI